MTKPKHPLRREPENDRQRHWHEAAKVEEQRGNDVAAAFFHLISHPSEAERAKKKGKS